MKYIIPLPLNIAFFFLSAQISFGQPTVQEVNVVDIENFWVAFDSVLTTTDTLKQLDIVQTLYIDKGTPGLKAFMELRNFDAARLLKTMRDYPRFWNSVRPETLAVHEKKSDLDRKIRTFKALYPDHRNAQIFFTITAVRAGGTVKGNMVLIGTEIAVGNVATEVSEFPDKRLENFFKTQQQDNIVPFVIHEYVHTQQKTEGASLLGQAIYEGACDFITELVLGEELQHLYLRYGRVHEEELKKQFKDVLFSNDYSQWFYNSATSETVGDLGYFMGYAICKSYYKNTDDKKLAIKTIIELDYSDNNVVRLFLDESGYYD